MQAVTNPGAIREFVESRRRADRPACVLVPTMGALHHGHEALIRRGAEIASSRRLAAGCIVTIFVNPTQFTDQGDLARYPRTLDADLELCRRAGAALVLAPDVEDVYPPGHPVPIPPLPSQATDPGLEDAARPGHFAGVCQVVARLFDLVRPGVAIFGEKDWQQLRVIDAMTRGASLRIEVAGAPTVREPDGLALSSRNVFLSPQDRLRARSISRALAAAASAPDPAGAESVMRRTLADAGITPDYAVIRDARTLLPADRPGPLGYRALIAGRVGTVRLLDNAPWPAPRGIGLPADAEVRAKPDA